MSFIYYSLTATTGPALITAQLYSDSLWTTITRLTSLLSLLNSIDFANYDERRLALTHIESLPIPKFFFSYPFDPLSYPLAPPHHQVRFPASGSFVLISALDWAENFAILNRALTYREADGPIDQSKILFQTAVDTFSRLLNTRSDFYDRLGFETALLLIWGLYPPIP